MLNILQLENVAPSLTIRDVECAVCIRVSTVLNIHGLLRLYVPTGSLPPLEAHPCSIHIVSDCSTGKSTPLCFVEVISLECAYTLINSNRQLLERDVVARLSSQAELLSAVLPVTSHRLADGNETTTGLPFEFRVAVSDVCYREQDSYLAR